VVTLHHHEQYLHYHHALHRVVAIIISSKGNSLSLGPQTLQWQLAKTLTVFSFYFLNLSRIPLLFFVVHVREKRLPD